MAFSALITLTTAGSGTGPYFNLFGNNDGYSIPFDTSVPKASLVTGYTSTLVPDGTTSIYVVSTGGTCNGSFTQINISGAPTVTPTPSPQPTIYTLNLGYDASQGSVACANYPEFNRVTVYSYTPFASITNGTVIYKTYAVPLTDVADNGWYSNGSNKWIVYASGYLYGEASCIDPTPTMTPTPTNLPTGIGIVTGKTYVSVGSVCADTYQYPQGTVYIGPGDTLSDGDILYTDPGLTTPFVGNSYSYYRLYQSGSFKAAIINSVGGISGLSSC